jgi:ParB family chromosome partitioning protein
MAPEKSTRRLGRGLDALFNTPPATIAPVAAEEGPLREIPITQIAGNPFQPRKLFKKEELEELESSLKSSGLLQPVTVRPSPTGKGYELVAGERRLRAASNIGWTMIPAVVREMSDQEVLTLALIENLQRSDLNPIEEAQGYDQLIRDFGYTQQSVAIMVGKDRSTVANVIRILQLPPSVQELVAQGHLSTGQARPLLGLEDDTIVSAFAKQVVAKGWSSREVERRVREAGKGEHSAPRKGRPRRVDDRPAEIRNLEQQLRRHFQTDVTITLKAGNRGTIVVDFYSPEDLERIAELAGLTVNPQ